MSDSATPWTVTHQAPPSMGFSRQEYWSGLPLMTFKSSGTISDYYIVIYIDIDYYRYSNRYRLLYLNNIQITI